VKRALTLTVVSAAVFWAGAAALLCENALNLPALLRPAPDRTLAVRIAQQTQSAWEPVAIHARDGARLHAWWFRSPDSQATVLVLHGVADTRKGIMHHSNLLLRHRFRVLAPDSRGHGESGGGTFTHGLRETDDVRRWVQWVRARYPGQPVYGLGESMGAAILLQAAGSGVPIDAIVAESSFSSFPEVARDRISQKIGPLGGPLVDSAFFYAKLRYRLDFFQASPVAAAARIQVPILLIHGPQDLNTPQVHSLRIQAANPTHTTLWAPTNVPHVLALSRQPAEFERRVLAHFRPGHP
jgi:alpha-beta hydrolase superfamily lysophospholipase